jgi:hypothetical protein
MSEILGLTSTSNPLGGIRAWNLCGGICVGHGLLQGTSSRLGGGDSYEGPNLLRHKSTANLKTLPTVLLSVNESLFAGHDNMLEKRQRRLRTASFAVPILVAMVRVTGGESMSAK